MPSEAEWEYAARAGTATARYWGEDAARACGYGNVHDQSTATRSTLPWTYHFCRDGFADTVPVGSFRANSFGLHDMLGNVWEWVEDCWNDSYSGAPSNVGAWTAGDCTQRVLRGGSFGTWFGRHILVRAANRGKFRYENRERDGGFRVAKTLP